MATASSKRVAPPRHRGSPPGPWSGSQRSRWSPWGRRRRRPPEALLLGQLGAPCDHRRAKRMSSLIRATVLSPFLAARSMSPSRYDLGGGLHHEDELPPLPVDGGRRGAGCHHRHPVLLGHVGHGVGDRPAVGTEHQIHLVLGDELFVEADGRGGLRPVVVHHQLELPPQHPALVVRVLDAELVAAKLVLAERRIRCRSGRATRRSGSAAGPPSPARPPTPALRGRRRRRPSALLTGADSTAASGSAACPAPAPPARRSPSCRPATGTAASCARSGPHLDRPGIRRRRCCGPSSE